MKEMKDQILKFYHEHKEGVDKVAVVMVCGVCVKVIFKKVVNDHTPVSIQGKWLNADKNMLYVRVIQKNGKTTYGSLVPAI